MNPPPPTKKVYAAPFGPARSGPPPSTAEDHAALAKGAAKAHKAAKGALAKGAALLEAKAARAAWVASLYAAQGGRRSNTHHLGDGQWAYALDLLKRAHAQTVREETHTGGREMDLETFVKVLPSHAPLPPKNKE